MSEANESSADDELWEALKGANDELGFVRFLHALARDWERSAAIERETPSPPYGPKALGWENITIGHFLESGAACHDAHLGSFGWWPTDAEDADNPWRRAAEILFAGKSYE